MNFAPVFPRSEDKSVFQSFFSIIPYPSILIYTYVLWVWGGMYVNGSCRLSSLADDLYSITKLPK